LAIIALKSEEARLFYTLFIPMSEAKNEVKSIFFKKRLAFCKFLIYIYNNVAPHAS